MLRRDSAGLINLATQTPRKIELETLILLKKSHIISGNTFHRKLHIKILIIIAIEVRKSCIKEQCPIRG